MATASNDIFPFKRELQVMGVGQAILSASYKKVLSQLRDWRAVLIHWSDSEEQIKIYEHSCLSTLGFARYRNPVSCRHSCRAGRDVVRFRYIHL